jgi:hypothetical protein
MRRFVVRGVAAVLLVAAAAACTSDDPFSSLPEPKTVVTEPTTSTTEVDLSGVPLPGVAGTTTTTIAIGPGPLTIVGRVEGPDGAVGGAIVQLERIVGDEVATTRVPTAADGTWNAANVLGGRYRIRAWRTPDLATAKPSLVFLDSGDPQRAVPLHLDAVGGVHVDAAMAPEPPTVDEPANLKVRVAQRTVDADGVVRDSPAIDVTVGLAGTGRWSVSSSNPSITGSDGSVVFRLTCRDAGPQPLSAQLSDGTTFPLSLQACVDNTPTSTTSPVSTSTTSTTR